ncbi:GNAT family N-acetyltransferase [Solimonas terrae]|uniref:GNAT family N-acetyltransferase n=1 Tax=Solimonas terrae TaxID=1396819 RepID=A0A6M2BTM9_9GAMM|nr:GNAT family N-acetyltransferase [Solimonas terrae]NGY05473.1 GNAT family N-acetyltransferase [Solimonas terrae]
MQLNLGWQWYTWSELDAPTLYDLLRLRVDVFVVEQKCAYPELDGLDAQCDHLLVRDHAGMLIGYLRLLPPGLKSPLPTLGRLIVAEAARGQGIARALAQEGVRGCQLRYPEHDIHISAQQHLEAFYQSLGFAVVSTPYLDDGIWHVDMRKVWQR